MFYEFPTIEHIDDIRPAIEGRPEFVIAERDGYQVVNYLVSMDDTFPPIKTSGGSAKMRREQSLLKAIRRELRGIIFDTDGKIISRRLHKFFNVNEREETLVNNIDFSEPHVILEKLDGSMITPFYVNGEIRWGTKMGLTDIGLQVEEFVKNNPNYLGFAKDCLGFEETPIFEWCSRKNRIVVDYPEDRLVLIAIRNMITGQYVSFNDLVDYAYYYDIDHVKAFPGNIHSMEALIESTRDLENAEGWVVRFDNGHMYKVKGDWYVKIHKVKDVLIFEKNIIDLLINNGMDDAKSFMLAVDRERVENFEKNFWNGIYKTVAEIQEILKAMKRKHHGDKKSFAINDAPKLDGLYRSMLFYSWDRYGPNVVMDAVMEIIKKNIGSQAKVDSVRHLWDNHRWSYNGGE